MTLGKSPSVYGCLCCLAKGIKLRSEKWKAVLSLVYLSLSLTLIHLD